MSPAAAGSPRDRGGSRWQKANRHEFDRDLASADWGVSYDGRMPTLLRWNGLLQPHLGLGTSGAVTVRASVKPRLLQATPEQRAQLEIGRFGIHWPEIDEDLELAGLLLGAKIPGAVPPAESNRS